MFLESEDFYGVIDNSSYILTSRLDINLMPKRRCPVCNEVGDIGYGKKTCCSECGKAWVKMSKAEQKARLINTDEGLRTQALLGDLDKFVKATEGLKTIDNTDQLQIIQNSENDELDKLEEERQLRNKAIRDGLTMPKGILD